MKVLISLLFVCATPVLGNEVCEDLWYTRNAIMDRAGYCFGSPLGQALFDNSDCTTKQPAISPSDTAMANGIREIEGRIGCSVDTSRRSLSLRDLAIRRMLFDQPMRDEFASGCLGWQGAPQVLLAGTAASTPQVGRIEPGDFVGFGHVPVGGWQYVTVHSDNFTSFKSAGWLHTPSAGSPLPCAAFAG